MLDNWGKNWIFRSMCFLSSAKKSGEGGQQSLSFCNSSTWMDTCLFHWFEASDSDETGALFGNLPPTTDRLPGQVWRSTHARAPKYTWHLWCVQPFSYLLWYYKVNLINSIITFILNAKLKTKILHSQVQVYWIHLLFVVRTSTIYKRWRRKLIRTTSLYFKKESPTKKNAVLGFSNNRWLGGGGQESWFICDMTIFMLHLYF